MMPEPSPQASSSAPAPLEGGPARGLRVVGIGCSAGGLSALEKLLGAVPKDSGLAFVVVQHLDPAHPSALPELLRRATSLEVSEAVDGAPLQPNHVHTIPPNKDLSLLHGVLRVLEPAEPRGHRLAIDFFFRALADDQEEAAVGVLLSGMDSDGVLGLRAIREKGGLTLTQTPESAEHEVMPRSAIDAGVVDFVAPPEELPARILGYVGKLGQARLSRAVGQADIQSTLDKIILLLRDRTGTDFSLYKARTLERRIERRMTLHHLAGMGEYLRLLRASPQELDILFKELLIGVTSFFRDPLLWDHLREEALPKLVRGLGRGRTLRVWVPACSTGEEAYSWAIVLEEVLLGLPAEARPALQVYATDLDADAIDKARRGVYPGNIVADVSPERLARRFVVEDGRYRISREIRERVVFAQQDILADPPFTKLDVLSCRNLLIYLGAAAQRRLLPMFHHALNPGGLLVLGGAETVGGFSPLFAPEHQKLRVYRRQGQTPRGGAALAAPPRALGDAGPSTPPTRLERPEGLGPLVDQLVQQTVAPPAVLVNADGDILYISGRTGKYLEPAAGRVNVNLHAMAREGLRDALTGALHRARDKGPVHLPSLHVDVNGRPQRVDVDVLPLEQPEALRGRLLVVFRDVATPAARRREKRGGSDGDGALELSQAREALRTMREEMQSSLGELRSSNEELQSTNEELQSTNEELISSKEELQSLNEELQTVNAELQAKVDELTWVRNDMANLLNSTEIATVFLDEHMRVRSFTADSTRLFRLIAADIGRPLADIVTELHYPELQDDARHVLRTLAFQEKAVKTPTGRWYRARIMPYRTQDNVIDGVVITFLDVTESKTLEAQLAAVRAELAAATARPLTPETERTR